jgi:hypothetical protein
VLKMEINVEPALAEGEVKNGFMGAFWRLQTRPALEGDIFGAQQ